MPLQHPEMLNAVGFTRMLDRFACDGQPLMRVNEFLDDSDMADRVAPGCPCRVSRGPEDRNP